MDTILQLEDTRGMQTGIDIGNESDGYRLTMGDTRGMQVGIDIGNEDCGYRLTVGVYSVYGCRYRYW